MHTQLTYSAIDLFLVLRRRTTNESVLGDHVCFKFLSVLVKNLTFYLKKLFYFYIIAFKINIQNS